MSLIQNYKIGNSRLIIEPEKRYIYHHIKTLFQKAGYQYGWTSKHDPVAVGIDFRILKFAHDNKLKLRIFIGEDFTNCYECNTTDFLEFSLQNHAIMNIKGVVIYIASLDLFKIFPDNYSDILDLER